MKDRVDMADRSSSGQRHWPPSGLDKTTARLARVLLVEGPSSRAQLGRLTGLSRTTISAALRELRKRSLVEDDTENSDEEPQIGRPPSLVRLSRRAGLVVGVDIGRRHIQVVLADLGYREIGKLPADTDAYRHPLAADDEPAVVLDKAALLVEEILERNNASLDDVLAVGLGLPAPVTKDNRIGSPTLLPGWADFDPVGQLARRFGSVPLVLGNDASLGALGEYIFGGMRTERHLGRGFEVLYVKVATGIGAGIVRSGQLHRGASGIAGELGHIALNYQDGEQCLCGSRGCLELYAGGGALLAKARVAWPDLADTLELVDRAKAGDPYCINVIKHAGDDIGTVLGGVVNLTGPDHILIGGELSDSEDILLEAIRERVDRTAMPPAASAVTISTARLKKWSSAWGGVALALMACAEATVPATSRHKDSRAHQSSSDPVRN